MDFLPEPNCVILTQTVVPFGEAEVKYAARGDGSRPSTA
jgi:hypothetical protein